jgi:hypothetical protein
MKDSKSLIAITLAVTLAMTPSAIAGQKTTLKAAGRDATTVVNTILSGAAIPTKAIGIDGDFYIDTKNANLYGPKTKGVWKIATSLKQAEIKSVATVIGEQGGMGATGAQGEKGDKGATGNTGATGVAGSSGVAGATGAKGNDGAAGAMGMSGAAGSIGSAGPAGAPGANGSAGAPGTAGTNGAQGAQGTQGIKGDTGVAGTNGAQGVQGIQGNAGATGGTGAAGISISYFVDLGTWTLGTNQNVGTSDSNTFGNLDAGSYTFEILVDGTFSPNTITEMTIGMQVITSSGTLDYRVFASDSAAYINGYGNRHYQFLIIGKVICSGATSLKMRAVDQYGATASNLLNFSGRALINKVGSIG